jgi:hypothetical protein
MLRRPLMAAAIIAGLFVGVHANTADAAPGGVPSCRYEDGSAQRATCVWDGRHRGDHHGASYLSITVKGLADDLQVRIPHRLAHSL